MNTESGLRERKKQRTRRDIATAAVRLFAEHGYEAVTVAQIAAAANVSRATFFNYFPDKEAVLFDDTTAHRDLLREVLTDLSHATTPRQALLQAVDRMLDGPALSLDPHSELVPVRARLIAGWAGRNVDVASGC
ncbi:TetR family transcriptional regulator, partial [Nonomuraea sp. NPDC055795]